MDDKKKLDCFHLWKKCFEDDADYVNYYFQEKMKDNDVLTLYEADTLTSMIHLNPYTLEWHKDSIEAHYIVGVATEPEYRKQGRMRILLEEALRNMYRNDEIFTYLMPVDERIYRPFGFRYIYSQNRVTIDVLPEDIEASNVSAVEWSKMSSEDQQRVLRYVNDNLHKEFELFAKRDSYYYDRLGKEMTAAHGKLLALFEGEKNIGIISYMYTDGEIEITEAVIDTEKTKAIYACLQSQWSNYQIVRNVVLLESHFWEIYDTEVKPIIMARILNVKAFLEKITLEEGSVYHITVRDQIIEENNKNYYLESKKNGNQVRETEEVAKEVLDVADLMKRFQCNVKVYLNEIV